MKNIWGNRIRCSLCSLLLLSPLVYAAPDTHEQHSILAKAIAQNQHKLAEIKKQYRLQSQEQKRQQEALTQLVDAIFKEQQRVKFKLILTSGDTTELARHTQYYHYFYQASAKRLADLQQSLQTLEMSQATLKKEQELNKSLAESLKRKAPETSETPPKASRSVASSFAKMKRKLPSPIATSHSLFKKNVVKSIASGKSLTFTAKEGEPVVAVYPGKVVFSEWLKGVGLLMIIDHGQGYMSLYGNNQKLYKSLGDTVEQGEMIASVGQSGGHAQGGLYFEIRKDGEPIDPSPWFQST